MSQGTPEQHALWRKGILSWLLWDQQQLIYDKVRSLDPTVDEAVLLCARQFGKSHLGVLLAIEDCIRYPDTCILIIGPTIKQTRSIVTPRLKRIARTAPDGLIKPSKSEGKWYIGDSELVLGGMDQNSSSERGKTLQNCYIEEVVDSDPDKYNESLQGDIGPALTHSNDGKLIFLTTLPKIPDHPFIVDTMAKAEMNGSLYKYTIDDNIALTPQQYEAAVRRAGGKQSERFRREYLCEIIRDRSIVVIPDFDAEQDVLAFEEPVEITRELFIDWGGVRDFTVAQVIGYDYLNDVDLVYDEMWWKPNTDTDTIVSQLRSKLIKPYDTKRIYADAPGQLLVDLNSLHGLQVALPSKTDWQANINRLSVRFQQRKIKIHPRCKLTIQTCQSGTFNKQKTDFSRSSALGHMDALACLMYGVASLNRHNPYPILKTVPMWQYQKAAVDKSSKQSIMPKKSFMPTQRKVF